MQIKMLQIYHINRHKQIMEYDLVIVETPLPHQPTLSCGLHKLYCGSLEFWGDIYAIRLIDRSTGYPTVTKLWLERTILIVLKRRFQLFWQHQVMNETISVRSWVWMAHSLAEERFGWLSLHHQSGVSALWHTGAWQ